MGKSRDRFFHIPSDSDSFWNACIGKQGHEINYIDGYMQAAITLAKAIFDNNMHGDRDTLVFPILFNARHALELLLKFIIGRLADAGVDITHPMNHDIKSHWVLINESVLGDQTLQRHVKALKPYVDSLSKIDDDGQELRYSQNSQGKKSLSQLSIASLLVIREDLDDLNDILSKSKYRMLGFVDERNTGSFTDECSRTDLLKIAKMLPPKSKWGDAILFEIRDKIKKRFNLSSNKKFSKAIEVIKHNREMKLLIGEETDLIHLTDSEAEFVVREWSKRHPVREHDNDLGVNLSDFNLDDWKKHGVISCQVNQAIQKQLTPGALADIETIFYMGRDYVPCEYYEGRIASTIKKYADQQNALEHVNHIMEKTNFLNCFTDGLTKLGRRSLAKQLLKLRPDLKV